VPFVRAVHTFLLNLPGLNSAFAGFCVIAKRAALLYFVIAALPHAVFVMVVDPP
jgi:hypothetical protein